MSRLSAFVAVVCLVLPAGVGPAAARGKDSMNIKEGVLDEIHLKVASIEKGVPVVIRTFSTEGVDLGTGGKDAKNEQRADATKTMLKVAPDMLTEAFKTAIQESKSFGEVLPPDADQIPDNALVIEGKFTRIDPGSRAKRYWASFGAGKSGVGVEGTVKDSSGKVLAAFSHTRSSGIGVGGGDYVKFLSDDTKDVGHDIASFLVKWATGGDLNKD